MSTISNKGILLETGTNELELMEYYVANYKQAINVLKIKRIIQFDPNAVTPVLEVHKSVLGMIKNEGDMISVIDLRKYYGITEEFAEGQGVVVITEFNEKKVGFLVDKIIAIRRIMWSDLETAHDVKEQGNITAMAPLGDHYLTIVDFESVVEEVFPSHSVEKTHVKGDKELRADIKIALADDSITIQKMLVKILNDNGYTNVTVFNNGKEILENVLATNSVENPANHYDIVLSDIEMPVMDGLTMCRQLKEKMPSVKVIIVSSLISEQLIRKCQTVKADRAIPKSRLDEVIHEVDKMCLENDGLKKVA
ncbi:MAG: chemotaxis protein CheV [Halobacteriovoraceae bacterium]|nr:chemotaxis protein CheV [Halobacteriovoraceae bacterium]